MVFTLEIKQEETLLYISGSGTYWGGGADIIKLKMPMCETNQTFKSTNKWAQTGKDTKISEREREICNRKSVALNRFVIIFL